MSRDCSGDTSVSESSVPSCHPPSPSNWSRWSWNFLGAWRLGYSLVCYRYSLMRYRYSLARYRYSLMRFRYSLMRYRYSLVRYRYSLARYRYSLMRYHYSLMRIQSYVNTTHSWQHPGDITITHHSEGRWVMVSKVMPASLTAWYMRPSTSMLTALVHSSSRAYWGLGGGVVRGWCMLSITEYNCYIIRSSLVSLLRQTI